MPSTTARRRARSRGRIEVLPSGALRVVVYAGVDPLTKRRHYLREIIPAGPKAEAEAEKALRRLTVQIDEQRSPKTTATVAQLLDEHFALLEVEPSTLATYRTLARKHILPLIGTEGRRPSGGRDELCQSLVVYNTLTVHGGVEIYNVDYPSKGRVFLCELTEGACYLLADVFLQVPNSGPTAFLWKVDPDQLPVSGNCPASALSPTNPVGKSAQLIVVDIGQALQKD